LSAVNSRKRNIGSFTSLVHCCVIKKNLVAASELYHVADVQFTAD